MLGNIPWRYRIPRSGPPGTDGKTSFLFLDGGLDVGVLNEMALALNNGCLGWVVIPVSAQAFRVIRKAAPLLMQIDLSSIGTWGIGL